MSEQTKTKLEILQDRISQYDIRFPVATLAKEMKLNKGYVSGVLNGQKPISDNFWETFNKKYPEKDTANGVHLDANAMLPGSATLQDLLNEKDQRIRDIEDNKRKMELLLAEAHKEKMVLMETLQANQRIQEIQLKAIESNLTKGQSEIKNLMYDQNKYWEDVLLVNPGLLIKSQGAAEGKKDISVSGEQAGNENKGKGRSGAGGRQHK